MSALSTFEQVELKEKLAQSSKEIERLNALVAMQAEALKAVDNADIRWNHDMHIAKQVELAISASSSTVAKWEAEKLLPLQRQVAMLWQLLDDLEHLIPQKKHMKDI